MTPAGLPPFTDAEGFDMETELDRFARVIYSNRSGVAQCDLDNWFEVNPSELDEFDSIKELLRRPHPLAGAIRIFEVTESPEGEIVIRGQRLAIVNSYTFHYVPNRKRQTIAPWAAFGQR